MATGTYVAESTFPEEPSFELGASVKALLKPIASLKLTVLLFALSIFIIFVGTLAQVEKDMWEVIELYFRSYVAWIDLQLFFPPTWFPELAGKIPGSFPMPGGLSIGILMSANLVAAHLVRFKIQAKGPELLTGLAIIGVGSLITYWVIQSGHSKSGLQGEPPFSWEMLWMVLRGSMFLIAIASGVALAMSAKSTQATRLGLLGAAVVFGALGVWAATTMPSPSSLRILWQLIQGGLAGIVLLVGCMFAFKKRAGIVLLHAGIALMMFSEFFVSKYAVEGRMSIREGETMNYVRDIRSTEIAVINEANAETDDVVVVPGSRLVPPRGFLGFGGSDEKVLVTDENLPFDIFVEDYIKNADLGSLDLAGIAEEKDMITRNELAQARRVAKDNVGAFLLENKFVSDEQLKEIEAIRTRRLAEKYADKGAGKELVLEEARAASGTDGGEVDFAGAYVELRKKGTDDSLGKYLLSQILAASDQTEKVEVDGTTYNVSLRFKRTYKPYSLSLKDVRKDDYLGTNTPMNYSSEVVVMESEKTDDALIGSPKNKVGDYKIWMNNPLRYSGETFYQSGYTSRQQGGGIEATDLQVVTNTGWMMPYVGCMLVTVGMLVHFSGTLWRFLSRLSRQELERPVRAKSIWDYLVPALVVLVFAGYIGSKMRPPSDTKANMKIHDFGKLPVVYQGRIKPFDTLARNTLRVISNKETVDDFTKYEEGKRRQPQIPAVRWLLDVMAGAPEANKHRVLPHR